MWGRFKVRIAFCLGLPLLCLPTARPASALELVTIASSTDTLDAFIPQYGFSIGIFAKHGITLSFIKGANGPAMIAAVVGGSADITHVGAALIFPAMAQGAPFTVLSANYDIDYTFIVRKSVRIDASKPYPAFMQDLNGMRIGVAGRGGATEVYARKMLTDAGMNPDRDITFIAVGTGLAAAGAFTNDQVDALVSIPPTDVLIGAENFRLLVSIKDTQIKVFSPDYLFTIFSANPDFVQKRPEVATAFCRAVRETADYIRDPAHRSQFADYVAKTLNLTPAQAEPVVAGYSGNFDVRLTKQRWDAMKAYAATVPDWDKTVFQPCARVSAE